MLKNILFIIVMAFILTPLFARDIEIVVVDAELGLPLEGAIILSWDGREHICNEDGIAVIAVPDDRQVIIQASYPGYETGRFVITTQTGNFILELMLS